jgi:hypothetical protein
VGQGQRTRQPSRKVLDNVATESLLREERSCRLSNQHRTTSSEAPDPPRHRTKKTRRGSSHQASTASDTAPAQKPSASSRFKRTDRAEAIQMCDFTSLASINHWFPAYVGKGQINIPLLLLSQCSSNKAKAKAIYEWRMLSRLQQLDKMKEALIISQEQYTRLRSDSAVATAPAKTALERAREREYISDGHTEMSTEFMLVLQAEEEKDGFLSSPPRGSTENRLSNKQIQRLADKRIREIKNNKQRAEKRKLEADKKVCLQLFCLSVAPILTAILFDRQSQVG